MAVVQIALYNICQLHKYPCLSILEMMATATVSLLEYFGDDDSLVAISLKQSHAIIREKDADCYVPERTSTVGLSDSSRSVFSNYLTLNSIAI